MYNELLEKAEWCQRPFNKCNLINVLCYREVGIERFHFPGQLVNQITHLNSIVSILMIIKTGLDENTITCLISDIKNKMY